MTNLQKLQHQLPIEFRIKRYNYNGIPIFCTGGIHENIFSYFLNLNLDKNISILVLGSGAGAFERRLLDNSFNNITSVEFVPNIFMVQGVKLLNNDLNKDFYDIGNYDAVFAIELIEHLENQFHFIRNVKKIMKKDAIFYLSTPSVENSFARIKYFLIGRLNWFGVAELGGTGHISPIFRHILDFNLSQNNLKIRKSFSNSSIWPKLFKHQNFFIRIVYFFAWILSLFMFKKDNSEINLFEITHND